MTLPAGVMLPSELERRQIFYTLKRWSSYTAWKRILDLYQAWADSIKSSLREASAKRLEDKTNLPESTYVSILKGLAHCDDGVSRLRKGDKQVFRCGFQGDFERAYSGALDHWASMLGPYGRIAIGENGIREEVTPRWAEFARTGWELDQAWGECSPCIIEPNDMGDPTHVVRLLYGVWLQENLPKMNFPKPLSQVPDPTESVLIRTGKQVPYSGIWEPVEVTTRKVISLFKSPPPEGPFPLIGCMNYLHGSSSAPCAKQETPSASLHAQVTWRLLWRDDRYTDGSIPDEEKSYVFLYPERTKAALLFSAPDATSITVRASGQLTPVAGRWVLQESLSVSITLAAGEVLPPHEGSTARWILVDM